MKAWKIVLVTTGLLLVMLAALAWVIFSRPLPLPTLAFLNYTNKPFTIVVAQVAFKNPSKVPLEILPQTRSENVIEVNGEFSHAPGYHSPFPSGLPRTIPPGGTTILDIHLYGDFREPWWTEVATRPQLEASRLRAPGLGGTDQAADSSPVGATIVSAGADKLHETWSVHEPSPGLGARKGWIGAAESKYPGRLASHLIARIIHDVTAGRTRGGAAFSLLEVVRCRLHQFFGAGF